MLGIYLNVSAGATLRWLRRFNRPFRAALTAKPKRRKRVDKLDNGQELEEEWVLRTEKVSRSVGKNND